MVISELVVYWIGGTVVAVEQRLVAVVVGWW